MNETSQYQINCRKGSKKNFYWSCRKQFFFKNCGGHEQFSSGFVGSKSHSTFGAWVRGIFHGIHAEWDEATRPAPKIKVDFRLGSKHNIYPIFCYSSSILRQLVFCSLKCLDFFNFRALFNSTSDLWFLRFFFAFNSSPLFSKKNDIVCNIYISSGF